MLILAIALAILQVPEDARTLCGPVQSYTISPKCETVLMAGSGPTPSFAIVIPADARARFTPAPEAGYLGQNVCATGIDGPKRQGVYSIVVTQPAQVRIGQPTEVAAFGEGAARACEASVRPARALTRASAATANTPAASRVSVEVVVDPRGAVSEARVLSSADAALDDAALKAARQWRFAPATRAGRPVPFVTTLSIAPSR